MTTAQVQIPPKLIPIFTKPNVRYRGAKGGRGSGKTRTFALMSAIYGYQHGSVGGSGVILCGREYMNSLEESSLEEVKSAIRSLDWLEAYYEIGEKYVRSKDGRIRYVFAGLRHNLDSIKSKAKIILAWIDEAESVSEVAWSKLLPTVREEGSEVYVTWNPESPESATHKRFGNADGPEYAIVDMQYWDNPWFPDVLELERQQDQMRLDPQRYAWIWEGAFLENSDKQVLAGKYRVAEFEPSAGWHGPYHGMDFGFAQDPTTAVRCWIHADRLYIESDCGKVGLELDQTAEFVKRYMPDIDRHKVRADCARPESISYLKRHGVPAIEGAPKWAGSVEDGIEHLRSYAEIVIHPRCTGTIKEARLYSYKTDRLTGDVLPKVEDDHNHYIDAIRYALAPLIKGKGRGGMRRIGGLA
jgi:phage terminase large subunit